MPVSAVKNPGSSSVRYPTTGTPSVSRRSHVAGKIENRLRAGADDDHRRPRQLGEIGRFVERRVAMHAANPAGREDLDARLRSPDASVAATVVAPSDACAPSRPERSRAETLRTPSRREKALELVGLESDGRRSGDDRGDRRDRVRVARRRRPSARRPRGSAESEVPARARSSRARRQVVPSRARRATCGRTRMHADATASAVRDCPRRTSTPRGAASRRQTSPGESERSPASRRLAAQAPTGFAVTIRRSGAEPT